MGNCLKSPTSDDISLLHESQSDRASFGDGTDPDLEPPPPYQVRDDKQQLPVLVSGKCFLAHSARTLLAFIRQEQRIFFSIIIITERCAFAPFISLPQVQPCQQCS